MLSRGGERPRGGEREKKTQPSLGGEGETSILASKGKHEAKNP